MIIGIFRKLRANALMSLGDVYSQQGRWEEAIVCYNNALEIFRKLRHPHGEANALMSLGNVYSDIGRWEEAIANHKKALGIFRKLGDYHGEAKTLMGLGNVYFQQGRWEEAFACYNKALEIFRKLGDPHGEANALMNLGNVYQMQGRWDEATGCYEQALAIFRELGDPLGEANALTNLGSVYAQQDRLEEAPGCYEQALAIFRKLGDRHGEASILNNLANLYAKQGELEKALETAGKALNIFDELKAYPDLVTCHRLMASFSLQAGNVSACFSHLAQALYLALQLHPKLVVDTIDIIVPLAKGLASEGMFSAVAVLGSGLWEMVMKIREEKPRSEELKWVGMLAQEVCAVIALMGMSRLEERPKERAKASETALEMAKDVDEETGGRWKLEEWVRS